ncbi:MAG: hypothetical protein JSV86_16390 [Gemmatimonadota bacterium]|nr:MAG: hypothetical protein JSV86_16390 [Gemmatimonadota bacterium]
MESLWNRVRDSQAEVIEELRDADFGHGVVFKGFTIRDPDGNVLRIGEPLHGKDPSSSPE